MLRQHAALGAEHQADAQPHDPDAEPLGLYRRALPVVAEAEAEATLAAVEFGQHLVVARPVPADRGAADQHRRACGSSRLIRRTTLPVMRRREARIRWRLPARPQAVRDRLARQVDDRVDRRVVGKLRQAGDQPERRVQRRGLARDRAPAR